MKAKKPCKFAIKFLFFYSERQRLKAQLNHFDTAKKCRQAFTFCFKTRAELTSLCREAIINCRYCNKVMTVNHANSTPP